MIGHWEAVQDAVHQSISGKIAEAIENLEKCIEQVPDDIYARQVLGGCYEIHGDYDKALEIFLDLEKREPGDVGTISATANVLIHLNRLDEAETKYRRALELEPSSGIPRLGLARLASLEPDEAAQMAYLHEAIEAEPGTCGPAAYCAIGWIHLRAYRLEEAKEAFQKAIEIDQFNGTAFDGLANVYIEAETYEQALTYLKTALKFNPAQPRALATMGEIFRDRSEFDSAIQACERALEISPKYSPAHNNLGRIYRLKGDHVKAEEYYYQAIDISPRLEAPRVNLAQLLLSQDKEEEAMEQFAIALRYNPHSYISMANLGVYALQREDMPRAYALFHAALRVKKDYALAHKYLGLICQRLDAPAQAADHLSKALDLDENQEDAGKLRLVLSEMQRMATTRPAASAPAIIPAPPPFPPAAQSTPAMVPISPPSSRNPE